MIKILVEAPLLLTDPAEAKIVAEKDWYAAPAAPPGERVNS